MLRCISPIDGSLYLERQPATEQEIARALTAATEAQRQWRATPLPDRQAICRRAVDYLVARADVLGEELTWQMGRPLRYTPFELKNGFQERALHMIDLAPAALADLEAPAREGFTRFIRHEPLGTVLVLAPWNYPWLTSVNVIIPALLAGNCVVLKHAEQTPLVAERYAEAFAAAGLPAGVFQYLHLTHEQVGKLIGDPHLNYVAFTGSVAGGRAVQSAVGRRFIDAGLELGGKDPAYVRADAPLENAIENLVDGAFFNSGQSCCGIERIYVHQSQYPDFVEGFVALTRQYQLGNPLQMTTTLGPMVRTQAAERVQQHIQEALAKGAQGLIDAHTFPGHQPGTPYLAPQVLIDVNHRMTIMREETFGPVVGIMSVRNDEEAIQLMNDSEYGLTASLWTTDLEEAHSLGDRLETGTVFLNRCDYLDPALAWTGVKNSGKGCTLSPLGYASLTRPKSFHLKHPTP
ncbi:MAG: aldehyde dehydrogenase family protein [Lewinellaceae bacterium]|nr:aldehyde dehydrogenase family protein [Lewinellaceae bacterium]